MKGKEIIEKIANVIKFIFGWAVYICLFVGGLSFIGYLIALITGGETAASICTFIYKKLYPVLVYTSTIAVLLGLVKMYLCGEIALSASKKKSEKSSLHEHEGEL